MAEHVKLSIDAGIKTCRWRRAANENTSGMLRPHF